MSWSPVPELEPDGSPTWWTRDPERSMNERYEVARRMTPARSPARLPRDQSPARFLIPQSPVRISHERSPTRMPRARSHARITSDLDYDIESDDEANVSGSMAASPIAEISPQFDPAGAVVVGGGDNGIYGGRNDDINKIDVCPICYEPWTCDGRHRTCCLPCGHIYGLSCIKNWLELAQGSGKCPQCKRACTLNDVRVLYATRLCAADQVNEAPTTHFPFTEEGFSAFQHYVFSRNEALEQRVDALEQRVNAFDRRPDALEQRVRELEMHVDVMLL